MAKKDFSQVNTAPVFNAIAEATTAGRKPRRIPTEEEKAEALETLHTVGLKGVKAPRINMAFTQSNYDFIVTMAQVRGQSRTEFVNDVLKKYRTENADLYNKALEFRNSL